MSFTVYFPHERSFIDHSGYFIGKMAAILAFATFFFLFREIGQE